MQFKLVFTGENRPDSSVLRELVNAKNYHFDAGAVYSVGPIVVEYLIRHHGIAKFLELYQRSTQKNFLTLFRELYGMELEEMEPEIWKEAREQIEKQLLEAKPPAKK